MKGDCTKRKNKRQPCAECKLNEWISPPMNRIPPPRPDETKLPHYHYKDVFESPSGTNACHHPPDDWQPRHNIKKCFDDGTLLGDDDAISSFSTIFIVEKEIIRPVAAGGAGGARAPPEIFRPELNSSTKVEIFD